jgi:sRNA-binding carbon storage regulator CsrA
LLLRVSHFNSTEAVMLILTRRPGEGLTIRLDPLVDPATPIGELLGVEGLRVQVNGRKGNQVQVAIFAPDEFLILRDEIDPDRLNPRSS